MKVLFFFLAAMFSAQMSFATNLQDGESLVSAMADGDQKAIALANKYVFQDIANENPELKEISPADLHRALNKSTISKQQRTRLVRYFDGAIERANSQPLPENELKHQYGAFLGGQMDPSNPYYGYWSIMYNMAVAYQTMFSFPMWMMWGPSAGFGGMYP